MQIKIGKSATRKLIKVSHTDLPVKIRLLVGQSRWFMENGGAINQWCVERNMRVDYINRTSGIPKLDREVLIELLEQWKSGAITEAEARARRMAMTDSEPSGYTLFFATEQNAFEFKMAWL